jgi:hypothetical protein
MREFLPDITWDHVWMQAAEFLESIVSFPAVVSWFRANWLPIATHWAEWGRTEILDKNCHTNNLCERWFGILKYGHLNRKTQNGLADLARILVENVVPCLMDQRCFQLAGRVSSTLQATRNRRDEVVEALSEANAVYFASTGAAHGHAVVAAGGTTYTTVLGDLSCSCSYAESHICYHLLAAHRAGTFTTTMREAAAQELLRKEWITVDKDSGVCTCRTFAKSSR